jgi:hypothetical protein
MEQIVAPSPTGRAKGSDVMAINWIVSLKDVPWTKVIGMTPAIVENGRKLWDKVASRGAEQKSADTTQSLAQLPAPAAIAAIEIRLASVEKKSAELREEVVSSFDVVRSIVDQNAQVVHAVDVLLARTQLLVRVTVLLGLVCVALLVLVLSR